MHIELQQYHVSHAYITQHEVFPIQRRLTERGGVSVSVIVVVLIDKSMRI